MDRREAHAPRHRAAVPVSGDVGALRDAREILERAAADEINADEARQRYRVAPLQPLEPDGAVVPLLCPGERVLAVRRSAVVERRGPENTSGTAPCVAGDLYVTSSRILVTGRTPLSFDLIAIEEAIVSGDRLLLILRDGTGLALDVDRPRLLRVRIAAARAAAHA